MSCHKSLQRWGSPTPLPQRAPEDMLQQDKGSMGSAPHERPYSAQTPGISISGLRNSQSTLRSVRLQNWWLLCLGSSRGSGLWLSRGPRKDCLFRPRLSSQHCVVSVLRRNLGTGRQATSIAASRELKL